MTIIKLFDLLTADCQIVIEGQEIDCVSDYATDSEGNVIMRCEDSRVEDWFFADQDVDFEDGCCTAELSNIDYDYLSKITNSDMSNEPPVVVRLSFWKKRELTLEDLT